MVGKIHFKVKYQDQKLDIRIVECKDLKSADMIGKSDPYVRLYIMPGRHDPLKTKVVNNNANPVFNTPFSFTLTPSQMISKCAIFQVFDSDGIDKDDPLGEARFPFQQMNLDLHVETEHWLDLTEIESVPPVMRSTRMSVTSQLVSSSRISSEATNNSRRSSNMSTVRPAPTTRTSYSSYSSSTMGNINDHHTHNLRELNDRLDNVISRNRQFEDVDTKLIINLLSNKINSNISATNIWQHTDHQLQPLRDEYLLLAETLADIEILKRENQILEARNHEMKEKIREREDTERRLREEKRSLEAKYGDSVRQKEILEKKKHEMEIRVTEARNKMGPELDFYRKQKLDLGKWEGELYIISQLAGEWESARETMLGSVTSEIEREIECPSIYWDVLKEYSDRMQVEVDNFKKLQVIYTNDMRGLEGQEIARLNETLSGASVNHLDTAGVLSELEIIKKRTLEMEMERLQWKTRIFEARFGFDQDEALFNAQYEAKTGALRFLQAEYENMKQKFFTRVTMADEREVARYQSTIMSKSSESVDRASRYNSADRRVLVGLSLNPRFDNGNVAGWDIEEHFSTPTGHAY